MASVVGFGAAIAALLVAPAAAQVTQRVSVGSAGAQGNLLSSDPAISSDGRYVAFASYATNLVVGDTNGFADVFVRDRQGGTTRRVSVDSAGVQGNEGSSEPSISADGRYVAFASISGNLVPGDTNSAYDIFVHDRLSGITARVSVGSVGVQANGHSYGPSLSADGRYVAFQSIADNLVSGDTNAAWDIFVRDRQSGITERVNVDSSGAQASGPDGSEAAVISADAQCVAFRSSQTNLVPADTNAVSDIFVRDRQAGTTERVSVDSGGIQTNSDCYRPSISADGRYVAFTTAADNLVPGDTNFTSDVFVRDRQGGTTDCASVDPAGAQGWSSSHEPSISADGRYVAFTSHALNLVGGDANAYVPDVYVRDRQLGVTSRESVSSAGAQANTDCERPSISAGGRYVVFTTAAGNLVPGDTNAARDVFLRDRLGAPSFTSLCVPGAGGVIACPCGNPPGGPGRGCDNSSSTGGAILSASGGTYLSSDSLVFTTRGEKPTALSIVAQWSAVNPTGVVFGQGVRCTLGALKRLYTKAAVAGSITAPYFGLGDPAVSTRSAALGDAIQPGQSRWYLVYYRDPIVLGGCPSIRTFNATQTGEVAWLP